MISIETYRTRIDTIKTRIETLKGKTLTICNLPGKDALVVRDWGDLNLPVGTVIAGDRTHVYLRVPHGSTFWASSDRDGTEPDGYSLEEFFAYLRRYAERGEQFRIVHQPGAY